MAKYINRQAALDLLWKEGRITTAGIKAIPAAHVAPVRYGRWIIGGVSPHNNVIGNWKCSECGGTSLKDSEYCPNCGAKMDKEEWEEKND